MQNFDVDLSFLNYHDEEDTARDAGVFWRYWAKKHHSPVLENIVEWTAVTSAVPRKDKKPDFAHLPQFKQQLRRALEAEEERVERTFSQIYRGKREQRAAVERWRAWRRRQIRRLHDEAWLQKEARDAAVRRLRDNYYKAECEIDRAEYVNFFLPLDAPEQPQLDYKMLEEVQLTRGKSGDEVFRDVLDACYAESGDEAAARCDAELYATLDLGLDPLRLDLAAPATARGTLDPEFERTAYARDKVETALVPRREKNELQWDEETKVQFREEKDKFLEKEWLEELKPARLDRSFQQDEPESFDVFQVMSAWVEKHSRQVPREEREALQRTQRKCREEFQTPRPAPVPERDAMLVLKEQWDKEDQQRERQRFQDALRELETRYRVCLWLLTVDVVKEFISGHKQDLVLQPRYEVQETVTQVEILTLVFENPELSKEEVEWHADEFLNLWLRLKDSEGVQRDVDDFRRLLLEELKDKVAGLIKDNYPVVGSWAKVRQMTTDALKTIEQAQPTFDFHLKVASYF